METFNDLYEFLQLYEENLLRLFAGLGLIDKIKSYDICKGNYNKKTITKNTNSLK
jgi:hypothetical protein